MSLPKPSRGEVWFLNLAATRDRQQAGSRAALVMSVGCLQPWSGGSGGGPAGH
jgi:hypothetical protein